VAHAIEVRDLTKVYGEKHALNGVSFDVAEGEVFALLGPNGAGKSTTVEILEGHRTATSGSASVLGVSPADGGREFRDRIGIVLQSSGIEDTLTVTEAIDLYRSSYRSPRGVDEIIDLVGLTEKRHDRVKTLSGGQQRRIDLALGLIGNPEVLFLDEPTTGFDPSARRASWELLGSLRDLGTTIVLTTHYMEEAERLADRVGVIVAGKIVAMGTPTELAAGTEHTTVSFRLQAGASADDVKSMADDMTVLNGVVALTTSVPTATMHQLTNWAVDKGVELDQLSVYRPTLEDIYLGLTEPTTGSVLVPGEAQNEVQS
jgi:ABC-2 type transport system ATP-binding protein